jgi:hypothetical protein
VQDFEPVVFRATASIEPSRWLRRPRRVVRFDARWPDGRVERNVNLSSLMYRRAPADFDVTRRAMLEHCPEIGTGSWVQWPYGFVLGEDGLPGVVARPS